MKTISGRGEGERKEKRREKRERDYLGDGETRDPLEFLNGKMSLK